VRFCALRQRVRFCLCESVCLCERSSAASCCWLPECVCVRFAMSKRACARDRSSPLSPSSRCLSVSSFGCANPTASRRRLELPLSLSIQLYRSRPPAQANNWTRPRREPSRVCGQTGQINCKPSSLKLQLKLTQLGLASVSRPSIGQQGIQPASNSNSCSRCNASSCQPLPRPASSNSSPSSGAAASDSHSNPQTASPNPSNSTSARPPRQLLPPDDYD